MRLQIDPSVKNDEKNCAPAIVCDNSSGTVCDDCSSIEREKGWDPLIEQWTLNWNTFFRIILYSNLNLRFHIRVFKESESGEFTPTKQGVMMTPSTWLNFIGKISNFKFESVNDSFICNNQLIVMSVDSDFCLLQQIFPLNTLGFFLKPSILKLYKNQVFKLRDLLFEITECIIESILIIQLPKLISNQPANCFNHLTQRNAKQNFLECLCSEIISCTKNLIQCSACQFMPSNELLHICSKPIYENFIMNRQEVFLSLNLHSIVKNVSTSCNVITI